MRLEIDENSNNSDKLEQGENNLSQQAGDLLGTSANTLTTSAERAEASRALTKDGTLPDFQLDMGTDDTNPNSARKGVSVETKGTDEIDSIPEAKDSGNSASSSSVGDSSASAAADSADSFTNPGTPESAGDFRTQPSSDQQQQSFSESSTSQNPGVSDIDGDSSSSVGATNPGSPSASEGGGGSNLGLSSGGDKQTSPVSDTQTQPTQFSPDSAGSESSNSLDSSSLVKPGDQLTVSSF